VLKYLVAGPKQTLGGLYTQDGHRSVTGERELKREREQGMTGSVEQPSSSPRPQDPSNRPADRPSPQKKSPAAQPSATGQAPATSQPKPPPPVGSDVPNRWLTSDPPGDIDALRSSSSLGHRQLPKRDRSRVVPILLAVVVLAGLAVWQLGLLDSPPVLPVDDLIVEVTTPEVETLESQVEAALAAAGFGSLTVVVDGDRAVVSGTVANEESLSAAALTVLNLPGVAQLDNRLEIGTVLPSADTEAALAAALTADEFAYVTVQVDSSLAVLQGAVPNDEARSRAVAAALGVNGIEKIDNRLSIDPDLPIGSALPSEQLEAAASTALTGAGIQTVTATVVGRQATLDGTVPLENLGSGFFAFVKAAETAVLSVDGIDQVSSRLTLRGDGGILRSELRALLEATPVEFALGSIELTSQSQQVLDQAAHIIQSQPGLQVIIAGHTDTAGSSESNQALSRQRAGAALDYLLTRGVPSYRLVAISYGELFPDQEATAEQNRRIEFEVGP